MEFHYLDNRLTTIVQGYQSPVRFWTPCTKFHNIVTTFQSCSKIATAYKF